MKRFLIIFFLFGYISVSHAAQDPIPGPRDCFWARGPHSADPYINLAYPDANVFYWAAVFTTPDNAKLTIEGEYPYSRYMSFISYDERGRPVESLADYLINSDSVNPFMSGNKRDSSYRKYQIQINNSPSSDNRKTGERLEGKKINVLNTPAYGERQQAILYRIYLPDDEKEPTGGVDLPIPVLTFSDGTELRGNEVCQVLRTQQPLQVAFDALGIPPGVYRKLITQEDKSDTWPAHNPPKWFIQLDRKSLIGMYTGDIDPDAPRSEGGFYPNLDNHYIRSIINRKHGKVLIVRGKAPTTPETFHSNLRMSDGELRYWSLCSNQSFANTRVNDCLFDEEIPVGPDGFYTIAISRIEDRPRNAVNECGIAWLPMASDGDGIFDPDVTIIQFRHMLTAKNFNHSIQRVLKQKDLLETMGPYMPKSQYFMTNQVETFFPCLLE